MKAAQLMLYILGSMVLILAIFTIGPMVETRYFPVYSKFRIIETVAKEKGLEVTARFTKFRNCDPQGFAWFIGDFKGLMQLPVRSIVLPGTVHRPLGTQLTAPFLVQGLAAEDLQYLYAETYHHCHPLWITRSVIYP